MKKWQYVHYHNKRQYATAKHIDETYTRTKIQSIHYKENVTISWMIELFWINNYFTYQKEGICRTVCPSTSFFWEMSDTLHCEPTIYITFYVVLRKHVEPTTYIIFYVVLRKHFFTIILKECSLIIDSSSESWTNK